MHNLKYIFVCILLWSTSCIDKQSKTTGHPEIIYTNPAIQKISELIEEDTGNPDLMFQRANLLYDAEQYEAAEKDLTRALELDSLNPDYYHLLADIYLDQYQSMESLRTLKRLLEIYPERIQSLLKMSEFQLILKQIDESIITINDILSIDPQNAEAYFLLGMNFRALNDTIRAINSFQRAVELDADLVDAWILLGNLHEAQEEPIALQCYENAIQADPKSMEALHSKAFFLQNHGQINEAIQIYRQIQLLNRNYSDAYLNLGILLLEMDSTRQAFEQFNILTGIEPENPVAHYYKGITEELQGNLQNAISDYQSALNLAPQYDSAAKALERLASSNE